MKEFVKCKIGREFGDLVGVGETLTLDVGNRQAASEREREWERIAGILFRYQSLRKIETRYPEGRGGQDF